MHCLKFYFPQSLEQLSAALCPLKLNVTGLPGSESRECRGGGGSESGTRSVSVHVCVQEGYRLCVFVVKTVCLVLIPCRRQLSVRTVI